MVCQQVFDKGPAVLQKEHSGGQDFRGAGQEKALGLFFENRRAIRINWSSPAQGEDDIIFCFNDLLEAFFLSFSEVWLAFFPEDGFHIHTFLLLYVTVQVYEFSARLFRQGFSGQGLAGSHKTTECNDHIRRGLVRLLLPKNPLGCLLQGNQCLPEYLKEYLLEVPKLFLQNQSPRLRPQGQEVL